MNIETKVNKGLQLFKDRLKDLRGEKTLQEVAQDLGLSRATLGYYESGERKPDIEILIKIANYYNVSSDYLLGLSDYQSSDVNIQIAAKVTGLAENTIKILYDYAHNADDFLLLERASNYLSTIDTLVSPSCHLLNQIALYLNCNFDRAVEIEYNNEFENGYDFKKREISLNNFAILDDQHSTLIRLSNEHISTSFLILIQNELLTLREKIQNKNLPTDSSSNM